LFTRHEIPIQVEHQMATILFMMWPETGHLNASFKIAKTLKARGHHVVYSQLCDFEDYVRAEGFEFVPFFSELLPKGFQARRNPALQIFEELGVLCDQFARKQQKTTLDFLKEELGSVFDKARPQLLLMDSYNARFLLPARRAGDPPCILLNPTITDPYDAAISAFVSGMTTLILCPEEFDLPQRQKRPQYRYVEASCDLQRKGKPGFPWDRVDNEKKLVYCSLGSQGLWAHEGVDYESKQQNVRKFLQAVVSAIAGRADWQLVLVLGNHLRAEDFHSIPENALVVNEAPQLEVLKKASLAITHGGMNTVKECILLGVPMLVFPVRGDMFANAERVVFHGLGLAAKIQTASAESINSMIADFERDPGFRSRVEAMREGFLRIERQQRAVTIIEERLAEKVNAHAMG
jgi:UDP:flavonoid glycosyltransferase YjiC (YdhE family)